MKITTTKQVDLEDLTKEELIKEYKQLKYDLNWITGGIVVVSILLIATLLYFSSYPS